MPIDPQAGPAPLRCRCHKLLLVLDGNTIEIKCNRCGRLLRIETEGIRSARFLDPVNEKGMRRSELDTARDEPASGST